MRVRIAVVCGCVLASAGCKDLNPIELGQCGNAVLEPGEDCDGTADPALACGASQTARACRYVCEPGAGATCPVGWGCGVDGVCRRPAGGFIMSQVLDMQPESVAAGDLDGDGRMELVGSFPSRLEIMVRGASGDFELGHTLFARLATGPVAAADLDGDGLADLVLPNQHGVSIWRGQPAGEPLPVAFSNVPLPPEVNEVWLVPAQHDAAPNGVLIALYEADVLLGRIVQWGETKPAPEESLGSTLTALVGDRLPVARLSSEPGDSIALAFDGSDVVEIRRIRKGPFQGGVFLNAEPPVSLGDLGVVARGARFAEVNGDDAPDLLIGLDDAVAVAQGSTEGDFEAPAIDPRFTSWPLAAADLDGDGLDDYVTPDGILRASPDPPYPLELVFERPSPEPWTSATVADLNGDGALDLVAFTEGTPQLDVLQCGEICQTQGGTYSHHPYYPSGDVIAARVGDLRDTLFEDIVVVSRTADHDLVSVMNGTATWPEEPRVRASFHRVERVEIGRAAFAAEPPDAFADVWLTTRSPAGQPSVGFLYSDADASLSASLPLQRFYASEYASGRAALFGRFTSGGDSVWSDVVFTGETPAGAGHAWWLSGAEDALLVPGFENVELALALGPSFDLDCARFAAGDLNDDGNDELVVASGDGVCGSGHIGISIGRFAKGTLEMEPQPFELQGTSAALAVADLDADGRSEVVVATQGAAHVFTGEQTLETPARVVDLPADQILVDAVPLARSRGATGPRRVVLLTTASIFVVDDSTAEHVGDAHDGRAVRSGEMNGDGLGDLIVHTNTGVEIWMATEAGPLGGPP